MEFVRIFDEQDTFWCPCYPEDGGEDILTVLFKNWSDTEYLLNFFKANEKDLGSEFWQAICIDKAVELVKEEVYYLQEKLICIAFRGEGCEGVDFGSIFSQLDKHEYILKRDAEKFIKGKIDSLPQMLRLYGIILEDGTIIITGGAIKLTKPMEAEHLRHELRRLSRVNDFLKEQTVYTLNGLN